MQKIIIGNWKMHKTIREAASYIAELAPLVDRCDSKVMLAVPATVLSAATAQALKTTVLVGAQNIDFHSEGPYTGEVSAEMVKDAGAKFVIVGHSERRRLFHESSELVNLKAKAAFAAGLQVVLCVGETYEERQSNALEQVLSRQLSASLAGFSKQQMSSLVLAYEPVWAIGTGLSATPGDALAAHRLCRRFISENWGDETAACTPIAYGGSVSPGNARDLLDVQGVDGLLVGGASLAVDSFSKIIFSQQALNFS